MYSMSWRIRPKKGLCCQSSYLPAALQRLKLVVLAHVAVNERVETDVAVVVIVLVPYASLKRGVPDGVTKPSGRLKPDWTTNGTDLLSSVVTLVAGSAGSAALRSINHCNSIKPSLYHFYLLTGALLTSGSSSL